MHYRKLDANGDMVFGRGRDDYLSGEEAVAQSVLTRLRLWRGEWYLDTEEGTPYPAEVLGKDTEASSIAALQSRVLDTLGVKRIVEIGASHDPDMRKASISMTLDTIYGEVTVNG